MRALVKNVSTIVPPDMYPHHLAHASYIQFSDKHWLVFRAISYDPRVPYSAPEGGIKIGRAHV